MILNSGTNQAGILHLPQANGGDMQTFDHKGASLHGDPMSYHSNDISSQ
jgi:hypothetical protein